MAPSVSLGVWGKKQVMLLREPTLIASINKLVYKCYVFVYWFSYYLMMT
jgi:hypothetical protein